VLPWNPTCKPPFVSRQHVLLPCRPRHCFSTSVRPSVCLSVTFWYCI